MLLLCLLLSRTMVKDRMAPTTITNIENILFYECHSEKGEEGGGLYINLESAIINVTSCEFLRCWSSSYGGGFSIKAGKETTIKGSVGKECTKYFNGDIPYGSFGILWTNGFVISTYVTECEKNTQSSVCLHFNEARIPLSCCNFSSNYNIGGYGTMIYYNLCHLSSIKSCIIMGNTCDKLMRIMGCSGSLEVSDTMIVNNNYNNIPSATFTNCCIFNSKLPQNMISCITDRIIEMDDYKQCKLGLGSSEFTQQRNHDSLLILALYVLMLY